MKNEKGKVKKEKAKLLEDVSNQTCLLTFPLSG
jgi:hypothetical protein